MARKRHGIEDGGTGGPAPNADLVRIVGLGTDYSAMLEAAGVHAVRDLAEKNATDLSVVLLEVNLLRNLVRAVPSEKRVAGWIKQAQPLRAQRPASTD